MIILDTNVLSELMREGPRPAVVDWVNGYEWTEVFSTTVSEAEIRYGVALMAPGERRTRIEDAARRLFGVLFSERVLPFDGQAARAYATIAARRRTAGRPISALDCQIAAIAQSRGAVLATRNTKDFEGVELNLVDPWGPDGP